MFRAIKKVVIVAFIVLFLLPGTDTWAQTLRILPLGNSITMGTDGNPPAESQRIAYRYTLYSLLTAAGYNFNFVGHLQSGYGIFPDADHGGIPGTRDQYLARLLLDGYDDRWNEQITVGSQPYLDVYPADIILLHIGTNDITHGEGASPNSVSMILDQIDAWKARSGVDAIVLVAKIINRKTYNSTTTQFNNNVAAMVNARNDEDIIMVDIENGAGIDYYTDMQNDGLHPYESGYVKIGQKWFEAIQDLNKGPSFSSIPVTSATEGETYSYTVTVYDENPLDDLTILAGTKPDWLEFTDNGDRTGLLTGIPGDNDGGTHPVSLVVTDGKELATQKFSINVENVNDAPVITGQYSLTTREDTPFQLTKDDLIIEDSDNDISEIDLIILSGDNYTVQGSTITPAQDYYGTLRVNVKAKDPLLEGPVYQALVTVLPVNDPPEVIGQSTSLEVKQFAPLEIKVSDFYYSDIDNNVSDLSVHVLPDLDTLYSAAGATVTPVTDTVGPITVRVVLDDGEDLSEEFAATVRVLSQHSPPEFTSNPPQTAIAGDPYFYIVSATDPDEGDILTFTPTMLPHWLQFNSDMKLLGGVPAVSDTGTAWIGIEVSDGIYTREQLYPVEVKLSTGIDHAPAGQGGIIQNLYPVPADESLFLEVMPGQDYDLQIINSNGRIVKRMSLDAFASSLTEIELRELPTGVYVLKLFYESKCEYRKFIIN
ncbi:MAG: T9SS type A sorting domain-containing protein [Bacteroidetes bacterium]|nr:T9SS type A sorting domain-containing protein [Bacteroidota bacterium]